VYPEECRIAVFRENIPRYQGNADQWHLCGNIPGYLREYRLRIRVIPAGIIANIKGKQEYFGISRGVEAIDILAGIFQDVQGGAEQLHSRAIFRVTKGVETTGICTD
jgi:hypothetical protein